MVRGLDQESRVIVEQTLERFVRDHADIHHRRTRLGQRPADERLHWPAMAELGFLALPFTEEAGGISGAAVDIAAAASILGAGLVVEPYVEASVIAARLLPATRAEALIDGSRLSVAAGAGADRGAVICQPRDGAFHLQGLVPLVAGASSADTWLITAWRNALDPIIIEVPAGHSGVTLSPYRLMDGRSAADLRFIDAILPAEALILEGQEAAQAIERAALQAVNAYAADAVGTMGRLVRETAAYLLTRKQFGIAIGSFQALQHRYADMHMRWLEAQAIARALAATLDGEREGDGHWLALATASVIERAIDIGHEAIQMHGGMGVTEELVISHLNARLVVTTRLIRRWLPRPDTMGGDHDA